MRDGLELNLIVHYVTLDDGAGAEARVPSLAVAAGRIARIAEGRAGCEVDGTGLSLAPGYIECLPTTIAPRRPPTWPRS